MITSDQLHLIIPYSSSQNRTLYIDHLNSAMAEYEINTPLRQAAFISQLAHESGSLNYVKELADGKKYEGRIALGNTVKGDGVKYKGRGLIQITGRANYQKLSDAFKVDFMNAPEKLEDPEFAVKSACWFWTTHGLNDLADKKDFLSITKKINGGTNGLAERETFYKKALEVIK